jgi:drug/metabolite transporter (DMT)-like permease
LRVSAESCRRNYFMQSPLRALSRHPEFGAECLSLIVVVAFFGVIAQFAVTKAYAIASPSLIAPFEYAALIWSAILGYLIWGDVPDAWAVAGALLIIGSGVYVIHRETLRRAQEADGKAPG